MNWKDSGIIINIKKYGENSAIVTALTEHQGLYSAIVKNISSPKHRSIYQIGNIVELVWKARLSEHLGFFSAELLNPIISYIMFNYSMLLAIESICKILILILAERSNEHIIYNRFYNFLNFLKEGKNNWEKEYVFLEINILNEIGFGLDLTNCIVTGDIENLKYISPKSGKAVSIVAAKGYEDKLFALPKFLIDPDSIPDKNHIVGALKITGHFFNKFLLQMNKDNVIITREKLIDQIKLT